MQVLGVNAGNGVILYPFKSKVVGNIELRSVFHTVGNYQWGLNFGDIPLIRKLNADLSNLPNIPNVSIIISHPDCGHSSVLAYSRAKKFGNPKENKSLTLFFKSVSYYNPELFLMENLTALIDNYGEKDLIAALPNYNLVFHHISVSELGNSQINRKRFLLIGVRKDLPKFISKVFGNIYSINELQNSGELIKGLEILNPDIGHIREDENDVITLYAGYKDVIKNIRNEWITTRAKAKRWTTPNNNFSTAPGVYKNLEFDYPATVRPTNRQYNHRGEMMSPRELARIQGIPDTFKLYYDTNKHKYCINKGRVTVTKTPPLEVSEWFYKQVMKIKKYIWK